MTQETPLNHWVSPFSHLQTKVTQILTSNCCRNVKSKMWCVALSLAPGALLAKAYSSLHSATGLVPQVKSAPSSGGPFWIRERSLVSVKLDRVQQQLLGDVI